MEDPDCMQEKGDVRLDEMFRLLIDHTTVNYRSPLGLTAGWDGVLFLSSAGSFLVCLVLWSIAKVIGGPSPTLWRVSLWVYGFGLLSTVSLVTGVLLASARLVTQPVASFLRMHAGPVKRDYQLLLPLRAIPAPHLQFLQARLQKEADHLRGRIGILIGAVDKVGLVPLVAGGIVSGLKLRHDVNFRPGVLEIAVAGLGLFYLPGVVLMMASHRLDELAHLVEFAASDRAGMPMEGQQQKLPGTGGGPGQSRLPEGAAKAEAAGAVFPAARRP